MPQLTQDAAAFHAIVGSYTLSVPGVSASVVNVTIQENAAGRGANGIASDYAGIAPAGGNSVVGFQSATFSGGYDTVLLDHPRSSYAVEVTADGVATIKDIGAGDTTLGQTVTVSGASYLIFNGGSSTTVAGLPVYTQAYFLDTPANAQMAQFFAAATQFKSAIALAGLEYWENQLAGGMSLTSIAQSFLNTSYFQTTYGDPGTSHAQHVSYIEALYKNILGMTLDANNAGVAYWAGQMDNGSLSGAATLISFTNATAGTSTINAVSGATAGSGGGWLINPSVTGGYADPGLQESASTVMNQGAVNHFYNLSLIDPSSLPAWPSSGVSADGVSCAVNYSPQFWPANAPNGFVAIANGTPASTIYLSAYFYDLMANNSGDCIHDGPGNDVITINGSGTTVMLGTAATDEIVLQKATGAYVFGFTPGHGSLLEATSSFLPTVLLNGTATPVQGSSLNFGTASSSSPIFVNIGSVGGNSAAEVATAANAAYKVSDFNGNAANGALGEQVMFLGTDVGGNTEVWAFRAPLSPVQAPITGADLNGNHLVDANEITLIATLIGVPASGLTAADLA